MTSLHPVDIFIVIAYLLGCLAIGFFASRKIQSMGDYALGGKYVPTFLLVGTFVATDIGAGSTVGVVERVYAAGLIFAFAQLFRPLFWLIAAQVFSRNIEYFRAQGCISISDIMENLYGKKARWITNAMAIIMSIGILALQIAAMGYLFRYFFALSPENCALVAFGVLVTYSFLGGIRAIIITDIVQAAIFYIGIPFACYMAYLDIKMPFFEALSQLPREQISIDWSVSNILLLLGLALNSLVPMAEGPFVQRYLMANKETQLKKAMIRCFIMVLPFTLVVCCIGFIMKLIAPNIEPNFVFFHLINTYLPIGAKGFLIAGVLAAIMSTADSWLNTASVICAHDIVKKIFPNMSDKHELRSARISLLLVSGFAAFITINNNESVYSAWLVMSFWNPIVLIPLCAGFLKFKTNSASFLVGCLAATTCVLLGRYYSGEFATISMMFGIIGSAIGLFGTHYWQKNRGVAMPTLEEKPKARKAYTPSLWQRIQSFSFNRLLKSSEKLVNHHGRHYYAAGAVGWLFFFAGLFLAGYGHTTTITILYAIAALSCVLLCLHEYLLTPARQSRYLPLYYHFTLLTAFLLSASYALLLSKFHQLWFFNFVLCVLTVYLFAGFRVAFALSSVALAIAAILCLSLNETYLPYYLPSTAYFVVLVSAIVLVANIKDYFQRKTVDRVENYAKMVAHQVMQPIAQTSLVAGHVSDVLNTYKQETQEYVTVKKHDFTEVQKAMEDFKRSSKCSEKSVHGLLQAMQSDIEHAYDLGIYSMHDCVLEALSIYTRYELQRIQFTYDHEFQFKGSWLLMVEVLRNIISNAFKYAGSNAIIEIWSKGNTLYIRDNGHGIDEEKLTDIFNPDNEVKDQSTGLGLPFCKQVMDAFGGQIECKSKLEKYTEFTLTFPEVELR